MNIPSAPKRLHGNFLRAIGSLPHCLMLSLWSNRNQPVVRSALLLRRPDEVAQSSRFPAQSPRQVQPERTNCCSMDVAQLAMSTMCCLRWVANPSGGAPPQSNVHGQSDSRRRCLIHCHGRQCRSNASSQRKWLRPPDATTATRAADAEASSTWRILAPSSWQRAAVGVLGGK